MSAQASAIAAMVISLFSLGTMLLALSYFYFAIDHIPTHVHVEERISQIEKVIRTRCTGTIKEACAEMKPIKTPDGYDFYMHGRPRN